MSDQFTPLSELNDSTKSTLSLIFSGFFKRCKNCYYTPEESEDSNGEISIVEKLKEKLTVKVVKTGTFYDRANGKVPIYKTSSEKRGKMLLINNVKFENGTKERTGAELDESNMTELFKQMGFDIETFQNLNKKNLEDKIKNFRNDESLKLVDIGVVVVMSHGTGTSLSDSTEVQCADGENFPSRWIIDQFDRKQCPALANKPKIFIFQCCRGARIATISELSVWGWNTLGTEEQEAENVRVASDMLIAHSTVPGFVAHRDPVKGSWYIQAICRVFTDHAHDTDVESMLKMVDHELSILRFRTCQTASFENRGFKTCYLHPM